MNEEMAELWLGHEMTMKINHYEPLIFYLIAFLFPEDLVRECFNP